MEKGTSRSVLDEKSSVARNGVVAKSLSHHTPSSCCNSIVEPKTEPSCQKSICFNSNKRKPLATLNINTNPREPTAQSIRTNTQPIVEEKVIGEAVCDRSKIPINVNNNSTQTIKIIKKSDAKHRKNIKVHRRLSTTSSLKETNVDLSTIFVDDTDDDVFNPLKASAQVKRQLSPILPNVCTSSSTLLQGIPEGVKRPKMILRKLQSSKKQDISPSYLDPCINEYLDDIILYQLNNNSKYVAKKHFLRNQDFTENDRSTIVNWLIQVTDHLEQPVYVLFMAIRLLDEILRSAIVPESMFQLIGLVVMWIISKLDNNVNAMPVSKILLICKRVYLRKEFLKLEKKVLKFFNYDLMMPDVTIFVIFYIKNLKLENEEEILNCANYILECYALNSEFSTVTYSKQAAAAVCLTLNIIHPSKSIWFKLKNTIAFHEIHELEEIMHNMLEQIHITQDPQYVHRQPYLRYSKPDKLQVSITLLRMLVAVIFVMFLLGQTYFNLYK